MASWSSATQGLGVFLPTCMNWNLPQGQSRRRWMASMARMAAGTSLAASTPGCLHRPSPDRTKVAVENQQPGTRSWMLDRTAIDPASRYRCPWVEGYASRTRVMAGESISFFVSTQPASHFQIDIYRICLLYTSPSPRDATLSRMPSSA